MKFQTKTIGRLCSLFKQGPDPILLLGAGASVKSGIPPSDELVEKIAKWGYCNENNSSPADPYIRRSDWYPWLKKQNWYGEDRKRADNYPDAVDNILQPRETRKKFFMELINPQVPPSSGYERMAELMARKRILTILTTNFDTILPDLCKSNSRPHHVSVIQTKSDFTKISTSPSYPQIIYLHGSIEHYTDKNNLAEIETLDEDLISRLLPLLRDHPLIVIGYRGGEPSVMKHLLINHADEAEGYRHGIYWCVRNYDEEDFDSLTQFVNDLAGKIQGNFQIVNIKGFDEIMDELWDYVQNQQLDSYQTQIISNPEELTIGSYDLQLLKESSLDDFEWATLKSRLVQYCEKTDIRVPLSIDDNWIHQRLCDQDLASRTEGGDIFPTVGGYLLFATSPQNHIQSSEVIVRVKGNPEWIKSVFDDSGDDDEIAGNQMDRIIGGNLWSQLDAIFDILSLVNQPFLLKDEVSATVQPYPPIALREIVVNALVHRDYTQSEPIVIELKRTRIRVRNPGGLVPEVVKQVESIPNFEKEIKDGIRGIKGYRNPVVADLFYGAETMEKEGSGLSDVWRSGNENRNEVNFGPIDNNTAFEITIHRRPEVVDEVTKTAYHRNFIRYSSNLLEIVNLPHIIWCSGTEARKAKEVWENTGADWLPPFITYAGQLFTFHDLSNPTNPLHSQINVNDLEKMTVEEFTANYGERRFIWLLNECLYKHLQAQNLFIDKNRMRAYFPKTDKGPRAIEYQARVRRATRTVVKRKNRYWEHKSFWFRFERFEDVWALVMLPSYVFTTDGQYDLLEGNVVNILSTKRQSRDYNNVVHNDLVFWSRVLSGEQQSTFALNIGPTSVQDSPILSNEIHKENGDNSPQILIKANLSTTIVQDAEPDGTLRREQLEDIESNQLAQLESEFSQAISQLEEVADVNSD